MRRLVSIGRELDAMHEFDRDGPAGFPDLGAVHQSHRRSAEAEAWPRLLDHRAVGDPAVRVGQAFQLDTDARQGQGRLGLGRLGLGGGGALGACLRVYPSAVDHG